MDMKNFTVLLLALISFAFAYYFLTLPTSGEVQRTYAQFVEDLSSAKKVYIIADLRNAAEDARYSIMQCGIDLAGSIALAPKNVSYFVIESNNCLSDSANMSASYCEELSKSGVAFYIRYGNATAFYKNRIEIGLQNYSVPCSVSEKPA